MWTFLASKYRNQVMFRGMTPAVWLDYVNYLLGDKKVYLMQVESGGKARAISNHFVLRGRSYSPMNMRCVAKLSRRPSVSRVHWWIRWQRFREMRS